MRLRSPALPSFTFGTYVGRQGALCAVTSKPELLRLAWNAWKFREGSGMYGRETLLDGGYQKSTLHGTWQLDEFSSCFALVGLYEYFGTLFVQPNRLGGWNSFATRPVPK